MTSYSRPVLDLSFSGLPDAATWPSEYAKAITLTAGASASVAGGWGVINLGTATGFTSQVFLKLWAYPIEGDKFDLLTQIKIITTGNAAWLDFYYRSTDNPADTHHTLEFSSAKYQLDRNTGFSNTIGPVVAQTWAANTIVWARLRVIGDRHMVRVWLDGTAEPQTWPTIWVTDANARVGKWFINAGSSGSPTNAQIAIGRISIQEIGDVYEPIVVTPAATLPFTIGGTLSVGVTGRKQRVYNRSGAPWFIVGANLFINTAPVGSSATLQVNRNGSSAFPISCGTTVQNATSVPNIVVADGDYLDVDVTAIGSTTAGADATLTLSIAS